MGKINFSFGLYEWDPPSHWVVGRCEGEIGGCGKRFAAALPKQYLCEPCRAEAYENALLSVPVNNESIQHGRIYEAAKANKLNIPKLADAVGINRTRLYNWNNNVPPRQFSQAKKLCDYLGKTYEELFGQTTGKRLRAMEKRKRV